MGTCSKGWIWDITPGMGFLDPTGVMGLLLAAEVPGLMENPQLRAQDGSTELQSCGLGATEHPLSLNCPLLLSQGMSRNLTQEGQRAAASGEEGLQDPPGRENCSRLLTNSLADIEGSLQRDAEAAYALSEVKLGVTAATGCGCCPGVILSSLG